MKHITSLSYPYLDPQKHIIHVNSGLSLVPYIQVPYQLELFNQLIDSLKRNAADLAEFLPWANNFTEEGFENHYQERLRDFDEASKSTNRSYFIKLHDEIIGALDLHDIYLPSEDRKGGGEIGYYLFKEHREKGFLRQALTALIEIYFTEYNFERFVFIIDAANARSINAALKIGAKFEGLLRRHFGKQMYQYSYILPDDYLDNIVQPEVYENSTIPEQSATETLENSDSLASYGTSEPSEPGNVVFNQSEETGLVPVGNAQFINEVSDISRMLSEIHTKRVQIQKDINEYLEKIQDLILSETKLKLDEAFVKKILRTTKEQEELHRALDLYEAHDGKHHESISLLEIHDTDHTLTLTPEELQAEPTEAVVIEEPAEAKAKVSAETDLAEDVSVSTSEKTN